MAGIGSGLVGVGERTTRDAREREHERERERPSLPLREGYSQDGREGRRRERDREREREWKSMSMALALALADEASIGAETEPLRPLPVTTASGRDVRPGSPSLPQPPPLEQLKAPKRSNPPSPLLTHLRSPLSTIPLSSPSLHMRCCITCVRVRYEMGCWLLAKPLDIERRWFVFYLFHCPLPR